MWPYPWTHVGTPSHLGHMERVAATMPSQAHAGAAQEAPDIGQWEGQDVPLVRPSSCNVKGGIPSSRRYLPTYLSTRPGTGCPTRCRPQSMGGTEIRLPLGGGLSPSGVARGGRSCRAMWRKASKRKSRTPSPRVAAWTRVAARMRVLVPEVRRHSTTSCSPSPRRCCRTALGLCRA